MLYAFVRGQLDRFARTWDYDVTYMREILDEAGIGAILPMQGLSKLSFYRKDVPLDVYYGAKLTAAVAGDCGPCAQLAVRMAERDGVAPALIAAIVEGDRDAATPAARLGIDIAHGTLARDGSGDAAREEILRRYGRRALASVAYGITAALAFPNFKYAIGHGHACGRLDVGGETLVPGSRSTPQHA